MTATSQQVAEEEWGRQKQNSPGSSPWEILDYGDGETLARHVLLDTLHATQYETCVRARKWQLLCCPGTGQ